ncbi:hypothetical protein DFH11DRAFT_259367 [Phellopilus nigrolimitatus]|nr:hypothetical protein DFH11DRAFT_259367 [Phellopilus nigrolimitatus]
MVGPTCSNPRPDPASSTSISTSASSSVSVSGRDVVERRRHPRSQQRSICRSVRRHRRLRIRNCSSLGRRQVSKREESREIEFTSAIAKDRSRARTWTSSCACSRWRCCSRCCCRLSCLCSRFSRGMPLALALGPTAKPNDASQASRTQATTSNVPACTTRLRMDSILVRRC